MNDSKNFITSSPFQPKSTVRYGSNAPTQYSDLQKQYMHKRGSVFTEQRAYLSSDYVSAKLQGIADCFEDYTDVNVRLSDVSGKLKTTGKSNDDIKEILVADAETSYIPIGAKLVTMGSTWIVTNTSNITAVLGKAIVERCNASYNSYDDFGNVVTEPIIVDQKKMLGNKNTTPDNLVLMDGYFEIKCQYNENTQKLGINKRIVLGSKPYYITGFTDFLQEFSGDRDSVHLLTFTARVEELTEDDDISLNYIANGKAYTFKAEISANGNNLQTGQQMPLQAVFLQNDSPYVGTDEKPVTWLWSTDNTSVVMVKNGTIIALSQGTATVTATLVQNPCVQASLEINVTQAVTEPYIAFDGFVPDAIQQYDSEVFQAFYYENGTQTAERVQWSFDGASKETYCAEESDEGNDLTIQCLSPSEVPLYITATYGNVSETISVALEGY